MFDIKGILDPVVAIINKVIPDKTAAAAAQANLQAAVMQGKLQEELTQLTAITSAQTDINKIEAGSSSVFVAGGRPAMIWICAAALAYQYLLRPIVTGVALVAGHPVPAPGLPGLDDNLYQLLWAMLGLGAMRSYDKVKGVDTKTVK